MTKNKKPLVSVLMPVYNSRGFLATAINSILNQTYRNFELIIVDDHSTDGSWDIVSSYKARYPKKVKAIRLPKNLGAGGDRAVNVAFSASKGNFVARMDADDIALPDRLEKQIQYFQSNPDVDVLGGSAYVINREGELIGEKNVKTTYEEIYKAYFVFHPMINPSVMIRKSVLKKGEQYYRTELDANNDYLTFFERIASGVKFANLPDKLLYYRIHGRNDSLIQTKARFLNSLKIRYKAVVGFGYRPTPVAVIKLLAQIIIVAVTPERLVVPLYMLSRGIYKPSALLANLKYALGGAGAKLRSAPVTA